MSFLEIVTLILEEHNNNRPMMVYSTINHHAASLIKALRREIKNNQVVTTKSIIKHLGGISGYFERKNNPTQMYIYFCWDISNPNFISIKDDQSLFQIRITNISEDLILNLN